MKTKVKQFGYYDGGLFKDPNHIKTCSESELYYYITKLSSKMLRLQHEEEIGINQDKIDLTPYQYAIEFCVLQTRRFGVKIKVPKKGEHIKVNKSFWNWFQCWDNYYQTLTY